MTRRSTLIYLCIVCIAVSLPTACSKNQPENERTSVEEKDEKIIGLLIAGSDACYNTAADVFEMLAKEEGWSTLRYSSDYQKARELLYIEELIAKKVDAIVMVTTDIITAGQGTKKANEAGIPIFFFMTMPEFPAGAKATAIVTSDWYMMGYLNGEYIAKTYPNARCALIEGAYDQGMTELMRQGFFDALEANQQSQASVVVNASGSWMKPNAMAAMEDLLTQPKAFDVIFTYNEEMMLGVIEELQKRDLLGQYKLISSNGREDVGWKYLREDILETTIESPTSQEGDVVFQLVQAYFNGEELPYHVSIPPRLLTKDLIETAIPWDAKQYVSQIQAGHSYRNFRELEIVKKERTWSTEGNNNNNIYFHK